MPALYDELDTAFIDLNLNAGLDWHCGPGNLNADTLFDDKAKNLVMRGVPVGIRPDHPLGNHVHFSLFRQTIHVPPCWRKLHLEFIDHEVAVVLISILAGRIHPSCWFSYDTKDMILL